MYSQMSDKADNCAFGVLCYQVMLDLVGISLI